MRPPLSAAAFARHLPYTSISYRVAALRLLIPLFLTTSIDSKAQQITAEDVIEDIREQVLADLDPAILGAGYAALVNFAVNKNISGATYKLDDAIGEDGERSQIDVYRFPIRLIHQTEWQGLQVFAQGAFAYQTFTAVIPLFTDEQIDAEWRTYGGAVTLGAVFKPTDNLTLTPAIDVGLVRLENEADYIGELTQDFVEPALSGLLFDWTSMAYTTAAGLSGEYRARHAGIDMRLQSSLGYNRVSTYDSDSELAEFEAGVGTFDMQYNTFHPLSAEVGNAPLTLVTILGATAFIGEERDTIGFNHFLEAGLALEFDVSEKQWARDKIHVGAKAIFGSDVSGFGIELGFGI